MVRESVLHQRGDYHAVIQEIKVNPDDDTYDVVQQCSTEFTFEGDSKGFEGILAVKDINNEIILMGLCEGNHCSEKYKNDRGNGRIVVMRKGLYGDDGCAWETIRTLDIPGTCSFADYSAMALNTADNRLAITSQEDSQVWIGRLVGAQANGLWDVGAMAFDPSVDQTLDFPKLEHKKKCSTVYCNIEGITWLDNDTLLAASDKTKGGGKQDSRCMTKDQAVHIFALPTE